MDPKKKALRMFKEKHLQELISLKEDWYVITSITRDRTNLEVFNFICSLIEKLEKSDDKRTD
jgi:hypothetical protein